MAIASAVLTAFAVQDDGSYKSSEAHAHLFEDWHPQLKGAKLKTADTFVLDTGGLFVALSASISVRPYKKYGVSSPGLVNLCDVARPAVPIPVGLGSVPSFWLSLMCCLRYSAPPANQ
jgi:hypothetical protein